MEDCIFCKIANGEIPSAALYEDDDFKAVLDLGPARKGHTLIIPKRHFCDLFDMPDDYAAKAVLTAKKVATALKKALGADGVQLIQNNGEAAGQTIFHFHMHLIPTTAAQGPGAVWTPGSLTDEEAGEVVDAVKGAL